MATPDDKRPAAMEELLPLVYDELRAVARRYFRRQPAGFTLRPTEVVHEACLHLLHHGQDAWQNADHFRAVAARKIWQVVVDQLKRRYARKRGGGSRTTSTKNAAAKAEPWRRVPLDTVAVEWCDRTVDLLDLAEAMEALSAESSRLGEVVLLHWFGGLTYETVAKTLGVSASTVEKDFRYALAWLNRRLTGGANGD